MAQLGPIADKPAAQKLEPLKLEGHSNVVLSPVPGSLSPNEEQGIDIVRLEEEPRAERTHKFANYSPRTTPEPTEREASNLPSLLNSQAESPRDKFTESYMTVHRRKSFTFDESFSPAGLDANAFEHLTPPGASRRTKIGMSRFQKRTSTIKGPKKIKPANKQSALRMVSTLNMKGKELKVDDTFLNKKYQQLADGFESVVPSMDIEYEMALQAGAEPASAKKQKDADDLGLIQKDCQDAVSAMALDKDACNLFFFGDFDGHGKQGQRVSNYLAQRLPQAIELQLKTASSFQKAFELAVTDTTHAMQEERIDSYYSGSTAAFACLESPLSGGDITLHAGNVGDARLLLGSRDGRAIPITKDHKPDDFWENWRVWWSGGVVKQIDEEGLPDTRAPPRIFDKSLLASMEFAPGLAVSRSVGDLQASGLGVIEKPSYVKRRLGKDDWFLVFGSDGLWDVFGDQEIVTFVANRLKMREQSGSTDHSGTTDGFVQVGVSNIAKEVVAACQKRWREKVGAREWYSIDDISCIVVVFKPPS